MLDALWLLLQVAVVVGLLLLTLKLIARFNGTKLALGPRRTDTRRLEVVERVGLARSASLVLVRLADRYYVLSVTEANVTMLRELDPPPDDEAAAVVAPGGMPTTWQAVWARISGHEEAPR